jgi:hypothetical protein
VLRRFLAGLGFIYIIKINYSLLYECLVHLNISNFSTTPTTVGNIFTRKRFNRDILLLHSFNKSKPLSVPKPKLNNELLLLIMGFWHTRGDFVMN